MAIEAIFITHEDGGKVKKSGEQVYEGSPITIDATTGQLKLAAAGDKVYGLSKIDSNSNRDFSFGEYGAFGSGQLTVVTRGQCEVSHSIFSKIEIDTQTQPPPASPVVKKLFDDTKTYQPMQPLYVDATGLISNVPAAGGKVSLFGKVLKPLAAGLSGPLVIEVDPSATHTLADQA
jgi:hypothetical protein